MKKRPYVSLDDWLEQTGTTQTKLAKLAGIDEPTLSRILRRGRKLSIENAMKLSYITGVPIDRLVPWEGMPKREDFERLVKRGADNAA